tara:strand:- start:5563 stop:6024 length:462 start_codon:yes stop_codon:yes gene_type:complete
MVAKKLSQQQVFACADKLSKQGTAPTAKKLLADIGMGSLTTHSNYLKQWHQLHDNDDNQPATLSSTVTPLSSDTANLFEGAITQCWQQGFQAGQHAMASELHTLNTTLAEKTAALEKAEQALLELQQKLKLTPQKADFRKKITIVHYLNQQGG